MSSDGGSSRKRASTGSQSTSLPASSSAYLTARPDRARVEPPRQLSTGPRASSSDLAPETPRHSRPPLTFLSQSVTLDEQLGWSSATSSFSCSQGALGSVLSASDKDWSLRHDLLSVFCLYTLLVPSSPRLLSSSRPPLPLSILRLSSPLL